jgi:hypothetical protein
MSQPPQQTKSNDIVAPLLNGMKMSSLHQGPTLFGLIGHIFDGIELKPDQRPVFYLLIEKLLSIPFMILGSINRTFFGVIHGILALPLSIIKQVKLICKALMGTFRQIRNLFHKFASFGFKLKKIKILIADIFTGIVTKVIKSTIDEFEAFIDKLTQKAYNAGVEMVKSIPFAGSMLALANAGYIAGDLANGLLISVARYLGIIKSEVDLAVEGAEKMAGLESEIQTSITATTATATTAKQKGGGINRLRVSRQMSRRMNRRMSHRRRRRNRLS